MIIVLYKVVDWESKGQMKLEELHELFKWTIKAIGKITHTPQPKQKSIQLISYKAFNSADADGGGDLDLAEVKNWCELNQVFT
jgi:uncharacterized protein YecE (DUF72 family)